MESIKLCFIVPEYQFSTATHFNYLYELIENLQQEIDFFLIIEKGNRPDFLKRGRVYVQKFRFLPLKVLENFLALLYARASGYQDFYIHYSFLSAFNASLIVKILGGRVFYWNCGLPWLYRRSYWRNKFERSVYQLVTFLVTGTEGLKKEYARHYRLPLSKIKVLPNWTDVSRFNQKLTDTQELKSKLNISNQEKVVLFTHRLSRRKGVHYLPEIARNIKSENAVLLIVGGGPEREWLEAEIKKSDLWEKVRFLNCVPNKEIQDYFRIADVFIMPSEEEGFPHVLLETMAAGVPYVAFDVGGVKEISPPEFTRYLVAAGNLPVFIEKIKELLKLNAGDLDTLKQKELTWVKQFDIKLAIGKFKNLFYAK